jgi:hypothetical protein
MVVRVLLVLLATISYVSCTRQTGRLRPASIHSVLHNVACALYLLAFSSFCNVFLLFHLNIAHDYKKENVGKHLDDRSVVFLRLVRTPHALYGSHPRSHLSPCLLSSFRLNRARRRTTGQPRRCASIAPCCRAAAVPLPSPRCRSAAPAPSPGRRLCSSPASRPQHIPRRVARAPPLCAEQCSLCSSAKFLKGNFLNASC